ncbi:MAG: DUF5723 family protein [Gemmatimonadales bacterium]|nr:DUF5723 family protein [Gemmatimonadales bacterium]
MRRTSLVLAGLLAPAALSAQLPDPSPRALAMGGAYTSLARGYETVAWNPAMLSANGRPGLSIGLPHLSLEVGSNTYNWGDFKKNANHLLSDTDKQYLLDQIGLDDSVLTVRGITGISPFGISIGPFAFAAGTTGDFDFSVGRDAVELALYGNAARSGPSEFFTARGSRARGWAATTVAGSVAHSFSLPAGRLSLGVTYKKVIGHALARAAETSSSFGVNPAFTVNAAGHAIYTNYASDFDPQGPGDLLSGEGTPGSGYGVDVGGVLQLGGSRLTLSAVLVNAVGSMTWDASRFAYERATFQVVQTAGGGVQDTLIRTTLQTEAEINADPIARAFRDSLLEDASFARLLRVGIAYRRGMLSLAAGGQLRLSEGLDRQPQRQISGGAEYRLLHVLPLRAGVATDFKSLILSGGTGIQFLGVNIDLSAASISGSERPGVVFGVGMGLIW